MIFPLKLFLKWIRLKLSQHSRWRRRKWEHSWRKLDDKLNQIFPTLYVNVLVWWRRCMSFMTIVHRKTSMEIGQWENDSFFSLSLLHIHSFLHINSMNNGKWRMAGIFLHSSIRWETHKMHCGGSFMPSCLYCSIWELHVEN